MKSYLRTLAKVLLLGFGFGAVLAILLDATGHGQTKPLIKELETVRQFDNQRAQYEGLILSYHYKDGGYPGAEFPKPLESEDFCKRAWKKLHVPCRYYFFHFVDKGRIANDGSIYLENGTTRHELIRAAMRSLIRDRDEWKERAEKAEKELASYRSSTVTKIVGLKLKVQQQSGTIHMSPPPKEGVGTPMRGKEN